MVTQPGASSVSRNLVQSAYVIESGDLVVEFAAPGRTHADVEVETHEDERIVSVVMREKDGAPGSLLNIRLGCTIHVPEKWKLEPDQAQCRNGLLRLSFKPTPPKTRTKPPFVRIGFQRHQWQ